MIRENTMLPCNAAGSLGAEGGVHLSYRYNNGIKVIVGQVPWQLMLHYILNTFGTSTYYFIFECMYKMIREGCLDGVPVDMTREQFMLGSRGFGNNMGQHNYVVNVKRNDNHQWFKVLRPHHRQRDTKQIDTQFLILNGAAIGFKDADFNDSGLQYILDAEERCRNGVLNMTVNTLSFRAVPKYRSRKTNVYYYYDRMITEIEAVQMGTKVGQELNGNDAIFGGDDMFDDQLMVYGGKDGKGNDLWHSISHSYMLHRRSRAQCDRDVKDHDFKKYIQKSQIVETVNED